MSVEMNKAVGRAVIEAFNTRNLESLDRLLDQDEVDHNPIPGQAPGLAGIKQAIKTLIAGFPDMQIEIADILSEGDRVVLRSIGRGTHTGNYMGIPPTGKKVEVAAIEIIRIANGKGAERWAHVDAMSLMQQLGMMPGPGGA